MLSPVSATRLAADKQAMLVNGAIAGDPAWEKRVRFIRAWRVVALVGLVLLLAHAGLGLGGPGLDDVFNRWLYDSLELLAFCACALRALWVPGERMVWALLAAGLLAWTLGDVLFDFVYGGSPPFPSLADGFYLAFYPVCYLGLVVLVRARLSTFNRSLWLDGVMAALACGALGMAVLFEAVLQSTHGSATVVVTNLAYPLGDVMLSALVLGVFAVSAWRPGRTWALLGSAFALSALADGIFLYQSATNTYTEGTILDPLWPAALLLIGAAAWQSSPTRSRVALEGRPMFATPALCGLIAIAVFLYGYLRSPNAMGIALAAATLVAVLMRTGLTFRENGRILAQIRSEAVTDVLTGLGNRRKLLTDLTEALSVHEASPRLLVIFDLNGFKRYNDSFGHPAGDVLLARLGAKLTNAVSPSGVAYRLGGDEFCVLTAVPENGSGRLLEDASAALCEEGEGFTIGASLGAVFVPEEAVSASEALRIADQRLYAHKRTRVPAATQTVEPLLRALAEQEQSLRAHIADVAELSLTVGRYLGLPGNELEELRLAAELHDIGKLAIPEPVRRKPGPLTEQEWLFVRQHPRVGQRILGALPGLGEVGLIIRATHERWDGAGYPDGLAGSEIPLAARIIAVCDAFSAITTARPYRSARPPQAAIAELRRCAGSQFDPEIVAALCATTSVAETPDLQPATSNGDSKPVGSTSGSNLARQPA